MADDVHWRKERRGSDSGYLFTPLPSLLEKDSKDSLPLSAGSSHCAHPQGPCCSEPPQQNPRGLGVGEVEKLQVIAYLYGSEIALELKQSQLHARPGFSL